MYTERILTQLLQKSKKSVLLLGPRQTGKSTLIRSLKPDLEINLADESQYVEFLSNPSLLKQKINSKIHTVFIDEVQRLPSILNSIQFLIDQNSKLKFYLTGSSARKLKRGKANLLPGRIISYELGPLTHFELDKEFELKKAMSLGLLPGIYHDENEAEAREVLKTYAITYLKEEIQAEALTRNLEGFTRFFQIMASRSGDFIDFTKFSNQAMIERTSATRYFEILKDTLVVNEVCAFTKSPKRRLIQHPRFYFFDTGVLNGLMGNFEISPDRIGNIFEHLVLQLILSMAKALHQDIRISVYRTERGAEVDFIVEFNKTLYAIEVKAQKRIGSDDLRGLKSFAEFYKKNHHSLIIYLGSDELSLDGVEILPLSMALKKIFG
jgi:uncharacterized protein